VILPCRTVPCSNALGYRDDFKFSRQKFEGFGVLFVLQATRALK
jgi:hypothetical protein